MRGICPSDFETQVDDYKACEFHTTLTEKIISI
jgi:hypothetical protein